MLQIECPNCKVLADETELTPGGEAHIKRMAAGSSAQEFSEYLFERKNPRGVHFEKWLHSFGCGKWFHVARCTQTLEIFGSYSGQLASPPKALLKKIKLRRPNWTGS